MSIKFGLKFIVDEVSDGTFLRIRKKIQGTCKF